MSTPLAIGLATAILLFFVALWLLITTLLAGLSGWSGLARRFPRPCREAARFQLKGQSGAMGMGVQAARDIDLLGLSLGFGRVAIWRAFAPFSKPFFVPWGEIDARPKTGLLVELMRLGFGNPEAGSMTVPARTWQRLATPDGQGRAEGR